MNYSIMIAAAFILATVAVAVLSPFDHLPQSAPQTTAAAAPAGDDSSSGDSSSASSSSYDSTAHNLQWPAGEGPTQ